jgi:hypothetical protein
LRCIVSTYTSLGDKIKVKNNREKNIISSLTSMAINKNNNTYSIEDVSQPLRSKI